MSLPIVASFLLIVVVGVAAAVRTQGHGGRIIGGANAEPGLAPYQISVQTLAGSHSCGGAILSERWIITAGHCVYGWPARLLRIATGSTNYREPEAVYYVDGIYLHCSYYEPRYHNDLALLHLNSSIVYTEHTTQPISINTQPLSATDQLLLTGWGSSILWGDTPEQLKKLQFNYVPRDVCAGLVQELPDVKVDVGHVCAFAKLGEGSCHGDSGGPLVVNNTLAGILAWSYSCADGLPEIYTDIRYYRDWLRQVMSGNRRCGSVRPYQPTR